MFAMFGPPRVDSLQKKKGGRDGGREGVRYNMDGMIWMVKLCDLCYAVSFA